jgi:hypothetical protein
MRRNNRSPEASGINYSTVLKMCKSEEITKVLKRREAIVPQFDIQELTSCGCKKF